MNISIIHIIIFVVGLIIGSISSILICKKYFNAMWIKRIIKVKNPELWDLAHFFIKDEEEEKTTRTTKKYNKNVTRGTSKS